MPQPCISKALSEPLLTGFAEAEQGAQKILEALAGLRFGSVEITVHEGRIVQIERKEKFRLNLACPEAKDIQRT